MKSVGFVSIRPLADKSRTRTTRFEATFGAEDHVTFVFPVPTICRITL